MALCAAAALPVAALVLSALQPIAAEVILRTLAEAAAATTETAAATTEPAAAGGSNSATTGGTVVPGSADATAPTEKSKKTNFVQNSIFWIVISIACVAVVIFAVFYWWCLKPTQNCLIYTWKRLTFQPTKPVPPPPPPKKVPEPYKHWYLNDVLAIDADDMLSMGPDNWEGNGKLAPGPKPGQPGFVTGGGRSAYLKRVHKEHMNAAAYKDNAALKDALRQANV